MPREKCGDGEVEYVGSDCSGYSEKKCIRVFGNVTDDALIGRFGGTFGGSVSVGSRLTLTPDGKETYILKHVTAYAE